MIILKKKMLDFAFVNAIIVILAEILDTNRAYAAPSQFGYSLKAANEPKYYMRKAFMRENIIRGRLSHRAVAVDEVFREPMDAVAEIYDSNGYDYSESEGRKSLEIVLGFESECKLRETVLELQYTG